tara:strand:- start:279 stop:458 length:180 start_codon:yes stop_codon:yes gene_type:complete
MNIVDKIKYGGIHTKKDFEILMNDMLEFAIKNENFEAAALLKEYLDKKSNEFDYESGMC